MQRDTFIVVFYIVITKLKFIIIVPCIFLHCPLTMYRMYVRLLKPYICISKHIIHHHIRLQTDSKMINQCEDLASLGCHSTCMCIRQFSMWCLYNFKSLQLFTITTTRLAHDFIMAFIYADFLAIDWVVLWKLYYAGAHTPTNKS